MEGAPVEPVTNRVAMEAAAAADQLLQGIEGLRLLRVTVERRTEVDGRAWSESATIELGSK